jgi:hypothetical protein
MLCIGQDHIGLKHAVLTQRANETIKPLSTHWRLLQKQAV